MVQIQDSSSNKSTLTAYKLLYGMENDRKHCEYLYLLCPIPFYSILSPHNSNTLIRILEVKESERSSDLPFSMYKLCSIMYIL